MPASDRDGLGILASRVLRNSSNVPLMSVIFFVSQNLTLTSSTSGATIKYRGLKALSSFSSARTARMSESCTLCPRKTKGCSAPHSFRVLNRRDRPVRCSRYWSGVRISGQSSLVILVMQPCSLRSRTFLGSRRFSSIRSLSSIIGRDCCR